MEIYPPASDDATKTVNRVVWSWCKHYKCRATGKVVFFTKHSSSNQTFAHRTETVIETTPPEETPVPTVETLTVNLTEASEVEDGTYSLVWEGFFFIGKQYR